MGSGGVRDDVQDVVGAEVHSVTRKAAAFSEIGAEAYAPPPAVRSQAAPHAFASSRTRRM